MRAAREPRPEPVRGRQEKVTPRIGGVRAVDDPDPVHLQRRRLGPQRRVEKRFGAGAVGQFAQFQRAVIGGGQLGRIGQRQCVVHGRLAGHRDRALGHLAHGLGRQLAGRDAGLPPADQHAKADFGAVGTLGVFQPAAPHLDRQGRAADRQRVRLLGTGAARGIQQGGRQGLKVGIVAHVGQPS